MIDNTIQILTDNGYVQHRIYIYKKDNIKVHLGKSTNNQYNECWKCTFILDDDINNSHLAMNNKQLLEIITSLNRDNILNNLLT